MLDDSLCRELLQSARRIAVVGLSPRPDRPSNEVARYLLAHGYEIVPVNPAQREILGLPCYPDLAAIPGPVDIVDVFRKSADVPPVAAQAVAIGARGLWLQLGVTDAQAEAAAQDAGLAVVADRCIKIEHRRLLG